MKKIYVLFVLMMALPMFAGNTVAVFPWMDMTSRHHTTTTSYEIERTIIQELTTIPEIVPLERERMDKILKEQALIYAGLIEEKNAVKLGSLLGAKYILWGSIEKIHGDRHHYLIRGRMESVETGEIFTDIRMKIPKKRNKSIIRYFSISIALKSGYSLSDSFKKEIDKITPYDISENLSDTLSKKFDIEKGKSRSDKAMVEMLNNKAEKAISRGDFKEALRNLNASLSVMPSQPDVKLKIEAIKRTIPNTGRER